MKRENAQKHHKKEGKELHRCIGFTALYKGFLETINM
jgi:hypothetical protein